MLLIMGQDTLLIHSQASNNIAFENISCKHVLALQPGEIPLDIPMPLSPPGSDKRSSLLYPPGPAHCQADQCLPLLEGL